MPDLFYRALVFVLRNASLFYVLGGLVILGLGGVLWVGEDAKLKAKN